MNTEEIKATLQDQGITYAAIAEASDLTVSYISSIITRRTTSKRASTIIAKAMGKSVEKVFPELFDPSKKHGVRRQIAEQKHQRALDTVRQRLAS